MKNNKLFQKHREVITYLFFGGLTSLITMIIYFLSSWGLGLSAWLSTAISWVIAVAFAFVTNKIFVFQNKTKKETGRQALLFFIARLISFGINLAIMFVFVDMLEFNELVFFAIAHIIVLVFNYIASKLVIFKK
ncbi:MAG: GtrA family protein [Defluviitaleaceae bacterium]|nr:GtrA family protein [Defluviitaleaceae bacterium]